MKSEPAAAAAPGLMSRFCSSAALPAGRMPGVTMIGLGRTGAQRGELQEEQTKPWEPASRATSASPSTCASRRARGAAQLLVIHRGEHSD